VVRRIDHTGEIQGVGDSTTSRVIKRGGRVIMTDIKTKPDGWVLNDDAYLYCRERAPGIYLRQIGPLLDAIDEVQEAFQTYFDCVEREDKQEEEYLKMKLDKLKEVRG